MPTSGGVQSLLAVLVIEVAAMLHFTSGYEVLQTRTDTIAAENYTYYRISRPGRLLIEVKSLQGDADLYISASNLKPSFVDYEMKSASCGFDFVEVPESYERPFGVGVYGHFVHEETKYEISVILLPSLQELDYEQLTQHYYDFEAADHMFMNYEASDYMYRDIKPSLSKSSKVENQVHNVDTLDDDDESVGSILWQILLTVLKVIFEVIL